MRTAEQSPARPIPDRARLDRRRPRRRRVVGRLGFPRVPRLGVALTPNVSDEVFVVFRGIGSKALEGRRSRRRR